MNLQNFKASKDPGVYTLYINDSIGRSIQGSDVANEINYLNEMEASRIDIEINSEGGGIIDGVKIASAIVNSNVPIRTINRGYAVSMAGVIYALGDEKHFVNFGLLMLHNPQFKGVDLNDIEDMKAKEVATKMKNQLMQLITMKCKNLSMDELSNMMDEETWLNCDEARMKGLVDYEIKYNDKKAPKPEMISTMPLEAYLNKIKDFHCSLEQNTLINNNKNVMQMEDLKKQYEARLDEKDSKLKEFQNSIADYENQIATLKDDYSNLVEQNKVAIAENEQMKKDIDAQKAKIKEFEDAIAIEVVNEAIEAGKFNAENRDALIEKATSDIDSFKNMVDMIPGNKEIKGKAKPKISEVLEMSNALEGLNIDDLNGKTRFEWLQKNDSKKLAEIKNKQPELYAALQDEYVNKYKSQNQ